MPFHEFLKLVGGCFELRLQDACRVAGINYQTACNQRNRGVFPLACKKRGRNAVTVSTVELHAYLFGSAPRRGRPCKTAQPKEVHHDAS